MIDLPGLGNVCVDYDLVITECTSSEDTGGYHATWLEDSKIK